MTAMIRFSDARKERSVIRDKFDLFLGIVATLEVWIGDRLLYREEMFPIVELRAALESWQGDAFAAQSDFEFQSMESDEVGLVWLRHVANGWRLGSTHQEFPELAKLTDGEVAALTDRFIENVDQWVLEHYNVRVSSFL
jgi:hypothetical protein